MTQRSEVPAVLRPPTPAEEGSGFDENAQGVSAELKLLSDRRGPPARDGGPGSLAGLVESYRRLADVFHEVLAEQSLDALLDRIADALEELIPHDSLTIYEADESQRLLVPVLVRDEWSAEILQSRQPFGRGITGWAAEHREPVLANRAHLDPRVAVVPGTPADEPEALICVPLLARGSLEGVLNVYRLGEDASFREDDFELVKRFGDAAALALNNAKIRARLEHQAQTDALTGLYNHRHFHERLRAELQRASRAHECVAVLMLDIDDFKRVNDVHGHGAGDEILVALAETLSATVRGSDVLCRVGGEEFGVIMPACDEPSARALAQRLSSRVAELELAPAGRVTLSIGLALGPRHAMNPRELVACADTAMLTAKARGKNGIVFFGEGADERPAGADGHGVRDVRSIAHLKLLQSLSGKLNRLNDVREIGTVVANELRSLLDYHSCRIFVVEGEDVVPIAFRGDFAPGGEDGLAAFAVKVGEGITGHVAATGRSLLARNAAECEHAVRVPGTADIEESLVAVPLCYGSRTTGVVVMTKLGLDQFDEDDVRLLEVLAGQASVALENARLYEAERREAESAKALLEFSRDLATADGLEEIIDLTVKRTAALFHSPHTSVWLQRQDTKELVPQAVFALDGARGARTLAARYSEERARPFLESPEPFLLTEEELRTVAGLEWVSGSFLLAPVIVDGGRRGCIAVEVVDPCPGADARRLDLLGGIAHQAKLAIMNAGNFESLEETFLSTVEALANALQANDEYTLSHARWITDSAVRVGARLGLEGRALKRLELGALLHDIGKLGISSTILQQPGPLDEAERRVVQTHPALGERILAPIHRLQDVCPIVRHCHERLDGKGYPDGKAGEEIPIESRIVHVCDAYHAMTTDRPYRKRLPRAEAARRLVQGSGSQFDPVVVTAFLEVEGVEPPA